jgi:molybdopterin-guanine dinucleotide biosynthesis protein A
VQNRKIVKPVILIGGKGRRLGKDKLKLKVGDEFILRHTFMLLQKIFDETPMLVGGVNSQKIGGLPVIKDAVNGVGPMGGLYTALLHTDKRFVFLTACDMPFIDERLLNYMYGELDISVDIYIPRFKNYIEPLFAFYNRNLLNAVKSHIDEGKLPLRSLLENARVQYLSEEEIIKFDRELMTFFNVNTKEDEIRLKKIKGIKETF